MTQENSINQPNEQLKEYIKSLTPEQAKEALEITLAWLAERQAASLHPPEKAISSTQ